MSISIIRISIISIRVDVSVIVYLRYLFLLYLIVWWYPIITWWYDSTICIGIASSLMHIILNIINIRLILRVELWVEFRSDMWIIPKISCTSLRIGSLYLRSAIAIAVIYNQVIIITDVTGYRFVRWCRKHNLIIQSHPNNVINCLILYRVDLLIYNSRGVVIAGVVYSGVGLDVDTCIGYGSVLAMGMCLYL